ncbi:unnamed protein product, partial [Symbiodinium sp. CCMP2456]
MEPTTSSVGLVLTAGSTQAVFVMAKAMVRSAMQSIVSPASAGLPTSSRRCARPAIVGTICAISVDGSLGSRRLLIVTAIVISRRLLTRRQLGLIHPELSTVRSITWLLKRVRLIRAGSWVPGQINARPLRVRFTLWRRDKLPGVWMSSRRVLSSQKVEAIFPDFHAGYRHAKAKAAPNPAPLDVDPIE